MRGTPVRKHHKGPCKGAALSLSPVSTRPLDVSINGLKPSALKCANSCGRTANDVVGRGGRSRARALALLALLSRRTPKTSTDCDLILCKDSLWPPRLWAARVWPLACLAAPVPPRVALDPPCRGDFGVLSADRFTTAATKTSPISPIGVPISIFAVADSDARHIGQTRFAFRCFSSLCAQSPQ